MPNVVAIEQVRANAMGMQFLLKQIGDGGLAGTGKAREPHSLGWVRVQAFASSAVHGDGLTMHVGGTAQRKRHHAGAHGGICLAVNENERARRREIGERIDRYRGGGIEVAEAHFVQVERTRRVMLQRIHIDLVLDAGNTHRHRGCTQTHQVWAARQQLLFGHPEYMRCKLVRHFGARLRSAQHIPTGDVDFVG